MPVTPERRRPGQGPRWRISWLSLLGVAAIVVAAVLITVKNLPEDTANQLLNVSYDPTREVYAQLDRTFTDSYRKQTGTALSIRQSHGGSGRQARSVIEGAQKPTSYRWH